MHYFSQNYIKHNGLYSMLEEINSIEKRVAEVMEY